MSLSFCLFFNRLHFYNFISFVLWIFTFVISWWDQPQEGANMVLPAWIDVFSEKHCVEQTTMFVTALVVTSNILLLLSLLPVSSGVLLRRHLLISSPASDLLIILSKKKERKTQNKPRYTSNNSCGRFQLLAHHHIFLWCLFCVIHAKAVHTASSPFTDLPCRKCLRTQHTHPTTNLVATLFLLATSTFPLWASTFIINVLQTRFLVCPLFGVVPCCPMEHGLVTALQHSLKVSCGQPHTSCHLPSSLCPSQLPPEPPVCFHWGEIKRNHNYGGLLLFTGAGGGASHGTGSAARQDKRRWLSDAKGDARCVTSSHSFEEGAAQIALLREYFSTLHCQRWCTAWFVGGWSGLPASVTVIKRISPAVPVFHLIPAWLSRFRWLPCSWVRTWMWCRFTVISPGVANHGLIQAFTEKILGGWCAEMFFLYILFRRTKRNTILEDVAHNLHI